MTRSAAVCLLAALVLVVLAHAAPQQQEPSPAGKAPFSFGPTYDEIVVETQLAVRPKVASAGLSLRSGRAKAAKAVFFRPNATASASGAEVRHITPLAAATTPTTPVDGISFAARVVSDVNPLAVERARQAAAAARARRQSGASHSSFSSSFRSSSSSGHTEHSGPQGAAAPGLRSAAPSSSHSSSTSSRTYSQQLADGHTLTVSETDDFQSSLGAANKAPTASRLHTVLVSSN